MPSRNIQWKSKKLAAPWKRIVAFLCDIIILLPPVAMVAGKYNFNPIPDVSLFSWTLYSLWGMYTIFLGIGLPLYANFAGVGDAVIKIGVTDLHGHRIGRLKLCARQFVCCLLLLWMILPSFFYAGIIVNAIFYSSNFRKDKRTGAYMHAVDRLFQTTVMTIEFEKQEEQSI